jgi:hypothetical protein
MKRPTAVLAGAALLCVAVVSYGSASYASTGQLLVLGHSNTSGKTTTIKMTKKGPALTLKTKKTAPPLAVSSTKLVKHLNSAEVGGMTAAQLRGTATQYVIAATATEATTIAAPLPIKPGYYQLSYNTDLEATADVRCFIKFAAGPVPYIMLNYGLENNTFATASAANAVHVTKKNSPLSLTCNAFDASVLGFRDAGGDVNYVTAIHLNKITTTHLAAPALRSATPKHVTGGASR